MMKIGIDIGRVIISGDTDIPNQFFGTDYLQTPAVNNAFESIKQLVKKYHANNIYLVSKCGEETQKRTLDWLKHHNFYNITGVLASHIHFCRERSEKANICQTMHIDVFIDDRFTVLKHLNSLKKLYLFSPSTEEYTSYKQSKLELSIQVIKNWYELAKELC